MTRILLIAHKFPPYNGVGGRRWQKLIEHLALKDIEITVLTQKWTSNESYQAPPKNVTVIRVANIFYSLKQNLKPLQTLITKLEFINRKLFKHTDDGYYFNRKVFKLAENIIKNENIDVLIATCPPYSSIYFAGLLKKKYPTLKVIQDVRDAWTDGYFSWNNGNAASHPTFKTEVEMELLAINNCDAVVTVTPGLLERIKVKIKNSNILTELITNGYDSKDRMDSKDLNYPPELNRDKLNICHFGTLDFGREDEFIVFIKAIKSNKTLADKINIVLIGNNNPKIANFILKENISNLILLPIQSPKVVASFMAYSDIHLLVNDQEFYYAYGSKIFDAFLYKKPVILVSKRDALTEVIERLKIGLTTDNSVEENHKVIECLLNVLLNKDKISDTFSYDNVDLKEFEISCLSEKYFNLIKKLTC